VLDCDKVATLQPLSLDINAAHPQALDTYDAAKGRFIGHASQPIRSRADEK